MKLSEKGLLKCSEWSDALAEVIKKTKVRLQANLVKTCYKFWISALETFLIEKNA